jgi:hypothetical protein
MKFTPEQHAEIRKILWLYIKNFPITNFRELTEVLMKHGFDVSRTFVQNILKQWKWPFKKADPKQPLKYTPQNLAYYLEFIQRVEKIDYSKLHYLDESSFNPRQLSASRGICRKGVPLKTLAPNLPISTTYSLTIPTTLKANLDSPFFSLAK